MRGNTYSTVKEQNFPQKFYLIFFSSDSQIKQVANLQCNHLDIVRVESEVKVTSEEYLLLVLYSIMTEITVLVLLK